MPYERSKVLEAFFDRVPDPVFLADDDARYVDINQAAVELTGYSLEEVRRLTVFDLTPRADLERGRFLWRRFIDRGRDSGRYPIRTRAGDEVWIDYRATADVLPGLHISLARVVDTHERRTGSLDERLLAHFPGVAYRRLPDPNWSHEYLSEGVLDLTGYPSRMLLRGGALSWRDLIHPDDWAKAREELLAALSSGTPYQLLYRVRTSDGSERWVWDKGRMSAGEEGSLEALEGFVIDVSDRIAAEEALRETNHNLASLMQSAPLGIVALDARERVVLWNPWSENHLGCTAQEAVGKDLEDLLTIPQETLKRLRRLVRQGVPVQDDDVAVRMGDGRSALLSITTAPLFDDRGRPDGVLLLLQDQTSRRGLEQQLRRAQKLEAVGQLAGGIAHDFNNVLAVIGANADLLAIGEGAGRVGSVELQEIQAAVRRAATLTRKLLLFSRSEVVQPRPLDLSATVEEVCGMARRVIPQNVHLELELEQDGCIVMADPGQMEQVVMNLLVNARDAMPDGGRLVVRTLRLSLDEWYSARHPDVEPGDYVLLSVSDTGTGMDEDVRGRIFEPFFTTKGPAQGTGLGLSVVYGIVRQSGGHIWVYSEPGNGASFKIYLPRVGGDPTPESEAAATGWLVSRDQDVLVVEDDGQLRSAMVRALQAAGYRVLEAGTAEQALELVRDGVARPALLLADLSLPGMRGNAVAGALRSLLPEVRVILMSGYAADVGKDPREGLPGARFLEKPFSVETLLRTAWEALEGE